jgi:hypothetical protein
MEPVRKTYSAAVDLTGEVRLADLDTRSFVLRLLDGRNIPGRFKPHQEALVVEALSEHATRRLRVVGIAEFVHEEGPLQQITSVERIEVLEAAALATAEVPIWERLAAIGAAVPADAWQSVPRDLSINVDKYLYGGKELQTNVEKTFRSSILRNGADIWVRNVGSGAQAACPVVS